jgi:signal peptidase
MSRRVHGVGRFLCGAMLNLAALGGIICLVLVALAFVFDITLIMFKTGSMSPTIPAGSLSLVREIPATEVKVGDVVTVDRPAALPITHRVTSVADGPTSTERIITMKGDANEAEDPFPYAVNTVRTVLASVPNLAYGVVWLSNPWVMAVLTLGASALVTWAFWPRDPSDLGSYEQEALLPLPEQPGNGSQSGLTLLVAPLAFGLALASPTPAVTEDVITSGHLKMISIGDQAAMARLAPGEPVQWQVGVSAAESEPGEVRIQLRGDGNAGLGLNAIIRSCDRRWVEGNCEGEADQVHNPGPIAVDGTKRQLTAMSVAEERWLLFDLWLTEDSKADAAGGPVRLQVHAFGSGDNLTVSHEPIDTLPPTGVNSFMPLFVAIGAIVLGIVLAGAAKQWRKRDR